MGLFKLYNTEQKLKLTLPTHHIPLLKKMTKKTTTIGAVVSHNYRLCMICLKSTDIGVGR